MSPAAVIVPAPFRPTPWLQTPPSETMPPLPLLVAGIQAVARTVIRWGAVPDCPVDTIFTTGRVVGAPGGYWRSEPVPPPQPMEAPTAACAEVQRSQPIVRFEVVVMSTGA